MFSKKYLEHTKNYYKVRRVHNLKLILFLLTFLPISVFSQANLKINVPNSTTSCGDTVKMIYTIQNFDSLTSIQFDMEWKGSELRFVSPITNLNTKLGLSGNNFGIIDSISNPPYKRRRFVWFDPILEPRSLTNGDTLFVFKFINTDTAGQTTRFYVDTAGVVEVYRNFEAIGMDYTGGYSTNNDIIPPSITCPGNVTLTITPPATTATLNGTPNPIATDNCDTNLDISYYVTGVTNLSGSGSANGIQLLAGLNTVHYIATDDNNLKDTCTFDVQVNQGITSDTVGFVIGNVITTCNSDIVVPVTVSNFNGIASVNFKMAWDTTKISYSSLQNFNTVLGVASSDFSLNMTKDTLNFLWTSSNGGLFNLNNGDTLFVVKYRLKDNATVRFTGLLDVAGGNPLTTITKVKGMSGFEAVLDNVAPDLTCPSTVTVNASGPIVVNNIGSTASDNCSTPVVTYTASGATVFTGDGNASGSIFNIGNTSVIYKATDGSGNSKTCAFAVIVNQIAVQDLTLYFPNISANCGDTIIVPLRVSNFNNVVSMQFATTWNPSSLKFISIDSLNTTLPLVSAQINADSQTVAGGKIRLSWIDNTNSGISLVNNATLFRIKFVAKGNTSVGIDTSSNAQPKLELTGGNPLQNLITKVVNGNVTVNDVTKPTITCPTPITLNADPLTGTANSGNLPATGTDNCSAITYSYTLSGATTGQGNGQLSNQAINVGTTQVVYTAADGSNNTATCSFSIEVTAAPSSPIITIEKIDANCGDTVCVPVQFTNFVTINSVQFTAKWDTSKLSYLGLASLNTTIDINASNFNTQYVNEGRLPFSWYDAEGDGDTLSGNATLFCIRYVVKGAYNGLAAVGFDLSPNAITPIEVTKGVPPQIVEFEVSNGGVNLMDNTPPTLTCRADTVVSILNGLNAVSVLGLTPSFVDNCGAPDLKYNLSGATNRLGNGDASGNLFNIGTTTVLYTAIDAGGNKATCSFNVVVNNNYNPSGFVLGIQSVSAECGDTNIMVNVIAHNFDSLVSIQYTLNWDPTKLQLINYTNFNTVMPLDSFNLGRTFINQGILTFSWFNTDPITLPDGAVLYTLKFRNLAGYGSYGTIGFDTTQNAITPLEVSKYPYPTLVTTSFINGVIQVNDNVPPTITCPADVTVKTSIQSQTAAVNNIDPIASDNCGSVTTTYSVSGATTNANEGSASGELFAVGNSTVIYTAEDGAGNTSTCTFNVFVKQVPTLDFALFYENKNANCSDTLFPIVVRALNFDSIVSAQFTMMYDTALLSLNSIGNYNATMALANDDFQRFDSEGKVTFSWSAIENINVLTLNQPDSVALFTLYMKVNKNKASQTAMMMFDTSATAKTELEVVQGTSLSKIPAALFTSKVGIFDTIKPTITCPANVKSFDKVVNGIAPTTFGDNCSVKSVTYTLSGATIGSGQDDASGTTFNYGTTVVSYLVTDQAGLTSQCSFEVKTGPDTLYLNVNSQTVNCGDTAKLYITTTNFVEVSSIRFDLNWDSTIIALNSYTVNPAFDILDFDGKANQFLMNRITNIGTTLPNGDTIAVLKLLVKKGGNTPVDFSNTNALVLGNPPVNYKIVANNGTIQVLDNEPPVIANCPTDWKIQLLTCDTLVSWTEPTASDNCGIQSFTKDFKNNQRLKAGTYTVNYKATDVTGFADSCKFTIIVVDTIAPLITGCPPGIFAFAEADTCASKVTWQEPTAIDECLVSFTSTHKPDQFYPVGVTVVVYTARDSSGNTSSCQFGVVVDDLKGPVFVTPCPIDTVLSTEPGKCGASLVWSNPIIKDNCSGNDVIVTSDSTNGQFFAVGQHYVTITARDTVGPNGNISQCNFRVTVQDNEPPTIIECTKDTIVTAPLGECNSVVNWTLPLVTDNCNPSPRIVSDSLNGGTYTAGKHIVSYLVTDGNGNGSTCSFTITVKGNVPPMFTTCPTQNVTVDALPDRCVSPANFSLPVVQISCGDTIQSFTYSHLPGDTFNLGRTTVMFIATSGNGLADSCSFEVIVRDVQKPTITNCPADISVTINGTACDTIIQLPFVVATDFCDPNPSVTNLLPTTFTGFKIGTTTVNVIATDNAGNVSDTCKYKVTVNEKVKPTVVNCPQGVEIEAIAGTCYGIAVIPSISAMDNCNGSAIILTSIQNGDTLKQIKTTVAAWAVDISGNVSDTCYFNITLKNSIPPTISNCPTDITTEADPINCLKIVGWQEPTATSNCGGSVTVTTTHTPNSAFPIGTTVVTYTAKESNGDSVTCSFSVSVFDKTKPVLSGCPKDTAIFYADTACLASISWSAPTATDNCTPVTLTSNVTSPQSVGLGLHRIVYIAKDTFNNVDSCEFYISVKDTLKPIVLNCPTDISVNYDTIAGGGVATWTPPTFKDNCSPQLNIVAVYSPGDTFPCGSTRVVYLASDASSNSSICAFNITVLDSIRPKINNCPTDITINTITGDCRGIGTWTDPILWDNCTANVKLTTSPIQKGDTINIGKHPIVFTATDDEGNSTTCSFTVTVREDIAPTITCPKDIIVTQDGRIFADTSKVVISAVQNTANCKDLVLTYIEPKGVDNCSIDSTKLTSNTGSGGSFPIGVTPVTYETVDSSGNRAACSFTVTILPIEAPKISVSDTLICDKGTFMLFADTLVGNPTVKYSWFGPDGFTSNDKNPTVTDMNIQKTGFYYAKVSINNCMGLISDSVYVNILTAPVPNNDVDSTNNKTPVIIDVLNNDLIRAGQDVTITITTNSVKGKVDVLADGTIQYTPIDTFYIGVDQFTYKVCYELCPDLCNTANVTINIKTNVSGCPIPSVITPNDDLMNDKLIIPCLTGKENSQMIIFNEWGDKIFEASPYYNNWWDGTYKGNPVPDGTYYYIFIEDKNNSSVTPKKGFVTVFR